MQKLKPFILISAKLIIFCVAFFNAMEKSFAQEVNQQEIVRAVETWVHKVTADARPSARVSKVEVRRSMGEVSAYVIHLNGRGFCLCGADRALLPVYYYSPHGKFDSSNPETDEILRSIEERAEYVRLSRKGLKPGLDQFRKALESRSRFWNSLTRGRVPVRLAPPVKMVLPLQTHWNQYGPYNNLCPLGNGGRTLVGCVATAMAQVMRYWSWPSAGVGSYSYNWDGDDSCTCGTSGGGVLTASFADPFDWNNMPNDCKGGCNDAQSAALAELSYEAGVSVNMDYGYCGSGAWTYNVPNALVSYFLYSPDVVYSTRDIAAMTTEILWLRPLILDGDSATEGHAWVVYGYNTGTDPNRQFKMNLGWGGNYDGWYTVDSIPSGYNNMQKHVTRIAPNNLRFVGSGSSGNGGPGAPYKDLDEAIANAPNGTTLIMYSGSTQAVSGMYATISKPLTLRGYNVTITKK